MEMGGDVPSTIKRIKIKSLKEAVFRTLISMPSRYAKPVTGPCHAFINFIQALKVNSQYPIFLDDGISINDDLVNFFIKLENNEIEDEWVNTIFTPKLTEEELKLVEERNEQHLSTYEDHFHGINPDVNLEEMKKSDSASKYVHGCCIRDTFYLTLESNQIRPSNEKISNKETKKQLL